MANDRAAKEDTYDDLAPQEGVHLECMFCPNPALRWPDSPNMQARCTRIAETLVRAGLLTEEERGSHPNLARYVSVYAPFDTVALAVAAAREVSAEDVGGVYVRENGVLRWKNPPP